MKVSVIIPKRKTEDISHIIGAIERSTYIRGYEYAVEIITVNLGLERSIQRNEGIDATSGDYMLILDSDQIPSPDLIGECVYLMEKYPFVAGIYIPEIIKTKGLFAYIRNWERQFYNATPIDVVRFVRAKNCPKFDENMSGPEDSDWDRQIKGVKITSWNPVYHYDNIRMIDFFRKKAYYSKSMKRFAERNPNDKILDWKWRCFGVFFERGKWKRFLSRPDLALAVLTLIFIRGVIYLWNE